MITYKGTDKDMKCYGGFQYELGKTYKDDGAIRCGSKGFHSCEKSPLDVWNYVAPVDGNRFYACEAGGIIDRDNDGDSKIASSELTIKTEIGIPGLIKAHIEYVVKMAKGKISKKDQGHAAAQGGLGPRRRTGATGATQRCVVKMRSHLRLVLAEW